jgi:serine protease Do
VTARVVENTEAATAAREPQGRGGSNKGDQQPVAQVLGMSLRQLTTAEKQDAQTQGSLVVEEVEGAAQDAGLLPGDIILGVAGARVKTVAEFQAAIASAKRFSPKVALNIQRGERQLYLPIRAD